MGRLWNRLLSRSVAPMLIADVGGILPPPPKSPCPSAPNHPTSTTMRSQDPNRQSKSLTGPGTGAGLPQRQRHTLGHHAPSKIRGAPNTGLGTVRARVQGECGPKPGPNTSPRAYNKNPKAGLFPPALTRTVSGRRGVHMRMRMHVLHTKMAVFRHLFYVWIRYKRWNTSKLMLFHTYNTHLCSTSRLRCRDY